MQGRCEEDAEQHDPREQKRGEEQHRAQWVRWAHAAVIIVPGAEPSAGR
jgi:hypothetical protein